MSEIIRLENVIKTVPDGRRVVNDVTLMIHERERVQITGPAGSGKTALLRLIAGMDRPDSGRVFVAGKPVHEMSEREAAAFRSRTIGACLRDPALMPSLPIWENVALPLTMQGVSNARRRKAAMEQLKALGIAYAAHARPAALSLYEQKLAALARALAAAPPILLLGEFAADLPEREEKRMLDTLGAVGKRMDTTLVAFASGGSGPEADRRLILDHGTIREEYR